jgi:hypothetical protein
MGVFNLLLAIWAAPMSLVFMYEGLVLLRGLFVDALQTPSNG